MAFIRVSLFTGQRSADLVLPDDVPLGALLPQMLELLGDRSPGGTEIALVTALGRTLDLNRSLADLAVTPGSMLRVAAQDERPVEPQVADVTDMLGTVRGARSDTWGSRSTIAALAVLAGVGVATASHLIFSHRVALPAGEPLPMVLLISAVLTAVAVFAARKELTALSLVLAAIAIGAAAPAVPTVSLALGLWGSWLLGAVLVWTVVGVVIGVGMQRTPVGAAAALGVLTAGGLLAASEAWGGLRVYALAAVIGAVLLGVIPGAALAISGLTRFDDLVIGGNAPKRPLVVTAVSDAFASLTWCVAAVALPFSAAISMLLRSSSPWPCTVAVAAAAVMLLRARLLPLVFQRSILIAAALLPLILAAISVDRADSATSWVFAVALGVAAVCVAAAVAPPSPVRAAQLRRYAGTAEFLAVLVLIPALLGTWGVFTDLLGVFR